MTNNILNGNEIDWSQLQAEAPVRKPLDPKNPKGASWGSSSLHYGELKYIRIDVGRLKSVKLVIPAKNDNLGADGKPKPVEPALLVPLEPEYPEAFKFFNGLEVRVAELGEEHRVAFGFGGLDYRNIPMQSYTKRIVNYKEENNERVLDKPPVVFLRIKPWTKFFKINGVPLNEEEKADLFKSIFIFTGIIKLTYIYMTKGKWSLQWNLDEATVLEMEPRTKKQTITPSLQDYITANPEGIEKLEKLLAQAKLDREKERAALGKHLTDGNANVAVNNDGAIQPGSGTNNTGGGIGGIPTSSELRAGLSAMPPAPNLAGFLGQGAGQPYLADPNQAQLGYFPGGAQSSYLNSTPPSAVPSASPSQVFGVGQYNAPSYQQQAALSFQPVGQVSQAPSNQGPGLAGPTQFPPAGYLNQGPFAQHYQQ